jgi:WD40 repeat protein
MVLVPASGAAWLASSVARDPGGSWLVGQDAEEARIGWEDSYFRNAKRLLGQPEPHFFDRHPFSILELVAQPLIHVAALARAQAGYVFDRLVLGAPVEFEGMRRDLLIQAGEMAGFPPAKITVITEAAAAARAALGRAPEDGTWLLFDMGGGTLDVALLRTRGGSVRILDTVGTSDVSGYVLDDAIMEHITATHSAGRAVPKTADEETRQLAERQREIQLRDAAEQAKRGVSTGRDGRAYLPDPGVKVTLSADELRSRAAPIIDRGLAKCEDLLKENGLGWKDLTAIVCAGGSTRGPVIRELLATRAPVREAAVNPERAVVPQADSRAPHPKLIHPANVGGVHLLHTLDHSDIVAALAFSPESGALAVASGKSISIWNPSDGAMLREITQHTDTVTCIAFGPDGRLASGSTDKTIRLRVPSRDKCDWERETETAVRALAWSPEGARIAWGGDDHDVHVWDAGTATPVSEPFSGRHDSVLAVAFTPDGSVLASAAGAEVRLWDLYDGAVRAVLTGHGDSQAVTALAFASDGALLVTASIDYTVRVWDVVHGTCLRVFKSHAKPVRAVAFAPRVPLVASGGDDYEVRLWAPDDDKEYTSPGKHGSYVRAVAFSPDGALLASGGNDNKVFVWGLG